MSRGSGSTTFSKILIPTDGSEFTDPAVDSGIEMAKETGARVTALYVLDQSVYSNVVMDAAIVNVYQTLEKEGREAVASVKAKAEARGVEADGRIVEGVPAGAIVAASADYDLIVMGTLGRTGMSKVLMGSVAEKVIEGSKCPVMVVRSARGRARGADTVERSERMGFQNILVPTDGSEYTKAAIAKAFDLAAAVGGRITALYVKDKNATDGAAEAATSYVAEIGRERGVPVEEMVLPGVPADVIDGESSKYDVIVMGTLGRTGLKKVMVGSVAETVVKRAKCPVIVVRKTERLTRRQ